MGRKQRRSKAERQRRREQREQKQQNDIVQDTVARLRCSAETAADMRMQCDTRLDDVDVDLLFAGLAHEVWSGRPGADQLAHLIDELMAEQKRHAKVMQSLGQRFHALTAGDHDRHEHLDADEVDPAHVRRTLLTPPLQPKQVEGQFSTESGGH